MFCFIKFSNNIFENLYDIRYPLKLKEKFLKDYKLSYNYDEKKIYIKNNVITINKKGMFFTYENDISVSIKDNFIVREYKIEESSVFNFYKSDVEEYYKLYENKENNIKLKEFDNYFTFEIFSDNNYLKI